MWIRARFDIEWRDFVAAATYCLMPYRVSQALTQTKQAWDPENKRLLLTLSVRSAFDLALRALQLPPGSEVLLTALTVPDMVRIVQEHGLQPVPVDTDKNGHVCLDSLRQSITSKTRAIVVAHLFGGRAPLDEVVEIAKQHEILVLEDCAQSFVQVGDQGYPESDLVMYSFGAIKTATALGGGVVDVSSPELFERMRRILASDPQQSRRAFAQRLIRYAFLKFLSGKWAAALFCFLLKFMKYDVDQTINSLGRGFSSHNLLTQLRKQPSTPLLRLLRRRWKTYDFDRIKQRQQYGRLLDRFTGHEHVDAHAYWIYPLFLKTPEETCRLLRARGYDATRRSRMIVVPQNNGMRTPIKAKQSWEQILFLPWYPELTAEAVSEMAAIVYGKQESKT